MNRAVKKLMIAASVCALLIAVGAWAIAWAIAVRGQLRSGARRA